MLKATQSAAAGDFTAAVEAAKLAVSAGSGHPETYLRTADFYRYAGAVAAGQAFFENELDKTPDNPNLLSAHASLARIAGDLETCFTRSRQALEKGAASPEVLSLFVEAGVALSKNTQLARMLRKLKSAKGREHFFPLGYALWRLKIGRLAKAESTAGEYIVENPADPFGRVLLGDVAYRLKKYELATRSYRAALQEEERSYTLTISSFIGLAESYLARSLPDSTFFFLDKADSLAQSVGAIAEGLRAQHVRMTLFSQLQLWGRLKRACLATLGLSDILADSVSLGLTYQKLGSVNQALGDYRAAIAAFEQALRFTGQQVHAEIVLAMARAYLLRNLRAEASELLLRSKALAERNHQRNLSHQALMLLADIDQREGELGAAREKLRTVLRFAQRTQRHDLTERCFVKLSQLYFDNPPEYDNAEYFLSLADALARQTSQLNFSANHRWMQGSIAWMQGEVELAESRFIQATQLGLESGSHLATLAGQAGLIRTYLGAGLTARAAAQADSALKYLSAHTESILSEPNAEYFDLRDDLFSPAIHAYASRGYLQSIYTVCEASKMIEHVEDVKPMLHLFDSAAIDSFNWETAKVRFRIQEKLREQSRSWTARESNPTVAAGLRRQIRELETVEAGLREGLVRQHPEFAALVSRNGLPLADLQNKLKALGSSFLHYYVAADAVFVVLVTSQSMVCKKINVSRQMLEGVVQHISPLFARTGRRQSAGEPLDKRFRLDQAAQLYKLIFEPIREVIPPGQPLIVSADDVLANFPIETLVSNPESVIDNYDYPNAHFLIEDHAISYVPAARFLNAINKRRPARQEFLSFSGRQLGAEPEFLNPANSVENRETGVSRQQPSTLELAGEAATLRTFTDLAPMFKFLRLALPGFLYDDMPMWSAIAFSANEGGSNRLMVKDVFSLKLRAEVAILDELRGSSKAAMSGLLHAFSFAGTGSLLLNVWQADSSSCNVVVNAFIENLHEGMDKPAALQEAKLAYLAQVRHEPFYWAGLVLHGDPTAGLKGQPQSKATIYLTVGAILFLFVMLFVQFQKLRREP